MSDTKKGTAVGDLSAYERWELPAFGSSNKASGSAGFSAPAKSKQKPPTAGELESIRKAAYDEGLAQGRRDGQVEGKRLGLQQGVEQGKKEGLQLGIEQGQQQINQSIAALEKLMQALADPIALQEQQISHAMSNVAIAIARSVIHRELHLDSSMIEDLTGRILSALPKVDAGVTIEVNPDDIEYVQKAVSTAKLGVKIEASKALHPGGCIVSTDTQLLDYTVEKRFQKSVQAMLLTLSQQNSSSRVSESPSEINEQSDYNAGVLDEAAEAFVADASKQSASDKTPKPALDDDATAKDKDAPASPEHDEGES